MATCTVVFSNHRPETLASAAKLMRRFPVVFLEEVPDPDFVAMLHGECSIERYVSRLDVEYPAFSRASCRMFQQLHHQGVDFIQVEPFIERLLDIHDKFAGGSRPDDIVKNPLLAPVYAAEKQATGRLIQFYAAAAWQPFETVLRALKNFARADAARFRMRDALRAGELAKHLARYDAGYIEAGSMHFFLPRVLKPLLSGSRKLNHLHLMADETRALTGKPYMMGPGDVLTLTYIFNPKARSSQCDRLAARSLVFNKVITKTEMEAETGAYPHIQDEWQALCTVRRLGTADCAALYPQIRRLGTLEAISCTQAYLKRHQKRVRA